MRDSHHPLTLADYLRVLRRHRLLLIACMIVAMAAALAFSLTQTVTYSASASLEFRDESREFAAFGTAVPIDPAPAQTAAANAATMTHDKILTRVKRELRTRRSIYELRELVSATPDPDSNLVVVEARGGTAEFAAALANSVAKRGRDDVNATSRLYFERAAARLRKRLEKEDDPATRAVLSDQLSRVQGPAAFSSPAQVRQLASTPRTPVAPRPVRNAIVGGALGLLLGILAAFARNSLDHRLRSSHEVQNYFKLPLVGHVRADALGKAIYLNGHEEPDPADLEAFRILWTNFEFLDVDSPPRTVAVTSSLAEEGKTTVASTLAFSAAAAGTSTLLVECDLRRPVLASRLGINAGPGLADYLSGRADAQDVIQAIPFRDPAMYGDFLSTSSNGRSSTDLDTGGELDAKQSADLDSKDEEGRLDSVLVCVTAGSPHPHPTKLLASDRFRSFLSEVSAAYELVVLDTCPLLPVADTLSLLSNVDSVLVCVRLSQTTRDQLLAGKETVERVSSVAAGLVVTGVGEDDEDSYHYAYAYDYGFSEERFTTDRT